MKRKLTKDDLKKTLAALGFKEGDEIELPSKKTTDANSSTTEGGEGDEDDEENGNHPPKKGGN